MRILIVGNVYSIHVRRWAEYFAPRHEVFVAYLPKDSKEEVKKLFDEGSRVNLIPLGKPAITTLKKVPRKISMSAFEGKHYISLGLKELKKAIVEIKPDIVHAHYLPDFGWLASQVGFHPLVLHAWGYTILFKGQDRDKNLSTQMFKEADLVFVGDKSAKKRLVEFGCPPEKLFIQAWGVDTIRFAPEQRADELRKELLDDPEQCMVLIAYALEDFYHVEKLVEAAPHVLTKDKNVKFMIIGDGTERKRLESLSRDLNLNNNLVFLGRIDNEKMHKYIASSDIYVDTFYTDKPGGGIGVAVMEAMSCGRPIVAAARPGIEAGVTEGLNGYFYEGGNPHDLAEKILLLSRELDLRQEFGRHSRARALEIGDWDKNMCEVEIIYEKLASK